MRLIDADALEPHEVYFNYGCQRIVYMDDIDEMPTIDAEPVKHGKWIYKEFEPSKVGFYVCSECGYVAFNEKVCHYCYNCGAKMEAKDEDY